MIDNTLPLSTNVKHGKPTPLPIILASLGRTLPPGYIHLGVAKEIAPTLRDFGIDPDPVIREAGLDPRLFDDGANVIPHAALGRLLTLSVARTNCPHFGLLVGKRATILSLGMVGRLMQHSETVGDALRALVSNLSIQNRGAVPSLTISGDTALFTFSVYQPEAESADQISDGSLAVAVNALRSPVRIRMEPDRGAAAPGRPGGSGALPAPFPGARQVQSGERHASSSRPVTWICGSPGPIP